MVKGFETFVKSIFSIKGVDLDYNQENNEFWVVAFISLGNFSILLSNLFSFCSYKV